MVEAVQAVGCASYFIEKWFGDCVYSTLETFAFCIGLSSVFFWLIAQLPQVISNFLRQSAEALSFWFLIQWLAGDSCNLLGCVLTGDQLATQTITAGYFIFADFVILTQYFYYQRKNRKVFLGVCYSDSDESMHKPSNGYNELTNNGGNSEHGNFFERSTLGKISQDSEVGDEPGAQARPSSNIRRADGDGAYHLQQTLFPFSVSDLKRQNSWMHEHRHRLRRLVQEYGLEYGQETVSRLNLLYTQRYKGRCMNPPSLSRRGSDQVHGPLKKARFKALLGATCLFGLASSNWYMFPNISHRLDHTFESVLGRRTLLALPDTAAISFEENVLEQSTVLGLNPSSAAQTSSQLLLHSHSMLFWTKLIGRSLGWVSSALYLGSRFSQIVKNKQRRSADGLSLGMFACAVLANLTYGASIFMRASSWEKLIGKAPWLVGSLGTVILDFSIFIQAHYYSWHTKKGVPRKYSPLLA